MLRWEQAGGRGRTADMCVCGIRWCSLGLAGRTMSLCFAMRCAVLCSVGFRECQLQIWTWSFPTKPACRGVQLSYFCAWTGSRAPQHTSTASPPVTYACTRTLYLLR